MEESALNGHPECPGVWRQYLKGRTKPIDIWMSRVRSEAEQLPPSGSADDRILGQLVGLDPYVFERVIVAAFQALTDVTHHVAGTRQSGDGGFDFFGAFRLPRPISYEIPFRGEVKRYSRNTAVDPKTVSRLVARLSRGEYGIFVTTSFFTRQAQREVLADGYPVHLISGADLIDMFRHLKLVSNGKLQEEWLRSAT